MYYLQKTTHGWSGFFVCDECHGLIEEIGDAAVLIQDKAGKYEPRSHFHKRCIAKHGQSQQMSLRQFIQVTIASFPDVRLPGEL
jgi:hypothetical protein